MAEQEKSFQPTQLSKPFGVFMVSVLLIAAGFLSILAQTPVEFVMGIASIMIGAELFTGTWWARIGANVITMGYIAIDVYQFLNIIFPITIAIIIRDGLLMVAMFYLSKKKIRLYFNRNYTKA